MKFSNELPPKKGIAGKFKEVAMAALLAVGVGAGEKAPKNPADKSDSKPVAEYAVNENKVFKSGADTFKTDGNMSMADLEKEMTGEFSGEDSDESLKVHKSGADTYKSDGKMSMPQEKK